MCGGASALEVVGRLSNVHGKTSQLVSNKSRKHRAENIHGWFVMYLLNDCDYSIVLLKVRRRKR
jgi:hypothetical protein